MPSLGRLHLITDTRPGRDPLAVVRAALSVAGPELVVQVRVDGDTDDRTAYELATRVMTLCAGTGATCLVNDRLHVALAAGAAGGHVGALDLPVDAARRVLGPAAVLGATARDPDTAIAAAAGGPAISASALVTPPPPRTGCRRRSGRPGSAGWQPRCGCR